MQEIRIGLVGAGWMGKDHSVSIANALMLFGPDMGKPVYELVADVNETNARQACEKLGYQRWTTDWMELVRIRQSIWSIFVPRTICITSSPKQPWKATSIASVKSR